MTGSVDTFLEAHPDVAAAWYPLLARGAGRLLTVPGLNRLAPLARRVDAVARPAGRSSLVDTPALEPPTALDGLTVLSANLWHDWPRQHRWAQRLDAVAELIEQERADVVLLQEVARTTSHHADEQLAHRLGMARVYARANGAVEAIGFEEGLAVLGRFPIERVHLRQLGRSHNPLTRRIALGAELITPLGRLHAVSVHLGLSQRANDAQLRALRAWVAEIGAGTPAVIGGDFNAPEVRREMARTGTAWVDTFRRVHPRADSSTHASGLPWRRWSPARRIDYVFLQQGTEQQWQVVDAAHLDAPGGPHSDHRAVVARLLPVTQEPGTLA